MKLQQHPVHCAPSPLSIELAESLFNAPDPKMFADGPFWSFALPEVPVMFGPNISGSFNTGDRGSHGSAEGAISTLLFGTPKFTDQRDVVAPVNGFSFDASLSNAIYGSSSSVQVPALFALACIKV